MPAAPITFQNRPQRWDDENLTDALNSFTYSVGIGIGIIDYDPVALQTDAATVTLPQRLVEPVPAVTLTPVEPSKPTPCPYPAPKAKKWLRNRGRLIISHTSFTSRDLWPAPIIAAAARRLTEELDPDAPVYNMSPKLALALIGDSVPAEYASVHAAGLTPHLDKLSVNLDWEDHGITSGSDRKFASDAVRELVRLGRQPGAHLHPFGWILTRRPTRCLLPRDLSARYKQESAVPAEWLLEVSRLTGVPVSSFIRYAAYHYAEYGTAYMSAETMTVLMGLLYDAGMDDLADELAAADYELPDAEFW